MSEQRYFIARLSGQEGPLSAEQVREGLRSGRYQPTDLSWAEVGEPSWIPLSERRELMAHSIRPAAPAPIFVEPSEAAESLPRGPAPELSTLKPLPPELAHRLTVEQWEMAQRAAIAWRRFLARSIDLGLALLLMEILRGTDLSKAQAPPWQLGLLVMALWPWAEALLLSTIGTTPGKALLRLRVLGRNGERPHFLQALIRSVWVWIQGMALGIPFARDVANILAFNHYTRHGRTPWDERAATQIQALPISQLRMTMIVALIVGSILAHLVLAEARG